MFQPYSVEKSNMITATIKSIAKHKGRIAIVVEYNDGTNSWTEELTASASVNLDWLKAQVRQRIKSIADSYAFADSLVIDQVVDITEPVPTTAEVERAAWLKKYDKWLSMRRAIEAGILTGTENRITTQKQWLIDNWKNEYFDIV